MKESNATGRRYDREFKQNAVELVRAGRTVSRVARDLGVSTWSLGRWVQAANGGQAQSEPKTLAAETDEQRELRRLRQEVDYLRQQRDILISEPVNRFFAVCCDKVVPGGSAPVSRTHSPPSPPAPSSRRYRVP